MLDILTGIYTFYGHNNIILNDMPRATQAYINARYYYNKMRASNTQRWFNIKLNKSLGHIYFESSKAIKAIQLFKEAIENLDNLSKADNQNKQELYNHFSRYLSM